MGQVLLFQGSKLQEDLDTIMKSKNLSGVLQFLSLLSQAALAVWLTGLQGTLVSCCPYEMSKGLRVFTGHHQRGNIPKLLESLPYGRVQQMPRSQCSEGVKPVGSTCRITVLARV